MGNIVDIVSSRRNALSTKKDIDDLSVISDYISDIKSFLDTGELKNDDKIRLKNTYIKLDNAVKNADDNKLLAAYLLLSKRVMEKLEDDTIKDNVLNTFKYIKSNLSEDIITLAGEYDGCTTIINNNRLADRVIDNTKICEDIIHKFNYSSFNNSHHLVYKLSNALIVFILGKFKNKIDSYVLFNILLEVEVYGISLYTNNKYNVNTIVSDLLYYFAFYDTDFVDNIDKYKAIITNSELKLDIDFDELTTNKYIYGYKSEMTLKSFLEDYSKSGLRNIVNNFESILTILYYTEKFQIFTYDTLGSIVDNFIKLLMENNQIRMDNIISFTNIINKYISDITSDESHTILQFFSDKINTLITNGYIVTAGEIKYKERFKVGDTTKTVYSTDNIHTVFNAYNSFIKSMLSSLKPYLDANTKTNILYDYKEFKYDIKLNKKEVFDTRALSEDHTICIPVITITVRDLTRLNEIFNNIYNIFYSSKHDGTFTYLIDTSGGRVDIYLKSNIAFVITDEDMEYLNTKTMNESTKYLLFEFKYYNDIMLEFAKEYDKLYEYPRFSPDRIYEFYKDYLTEISPNSVTALMELSTIMNTDEDNEFNKYIRHNNIPFQHSSTTNVKINTKDLVYDPNIVLESTKLFHTILLEGKFNFNDVKMTITGAIDKLKTSTNKVGGTTFNNIKGAADSFSKMIDNYLKQESRDKILNDNVGATFKRVMGMCIDFILIAGVFNIGVAVIATIGHLFVSKGVTDRERQKMIDEIDVELKVLEKEINEAESNNDMKRYRKLLSLEKKLQREAIKIKNKSKIGKQMANRKMDNNSINEVDY